MPAVPDRAQQAPVSPVRPRTQAVVAVVFLAVWLALEAWDFLVNGNAPVLPLWWHFLGVLILGYILGMNVPGLLSTVFRGGK